MPGPSMGTHSRANDPATINELQNPPTLEWSQPYTHGAPATRPLARSMNAMYAATFICITSVLWFSSRLLARRCVYLFLPLDLEEYQLTYAELIVNQRVDYASDWHGSISFCADSWRPSGTRERHVLFPSVKEHSKTRIRKLPRTDVWMLHNPWIKDGLNIINIVIYEYLILLR